MVKPLISLCAEVAVVTTPYGGKRCQNALARASFERCDLK